MAGSLRHIIDHKGRFTTDGIENLGDATEALEECFFIIKKLTNGKAETINTVCNKYNIPNIDMDLN